HARAGEEIIRRQRLRRRAPSPAVLSDIKPAAPGTLAWQSCDVSWAICATADRARECVLPVNVLPMIRTLISAAVSLLSASAIAESAPGTSAPKISASAKVFVASCIDRL